MKIIRFESFRICSIPRLGSANIRIMKVSKEKTIALPQTFLWALLKMKKIVPVVITEETRL